MDVVEGAEQADSQLERESRGRSWFVILFVMIVVVICGSGGSGGRR